MQKFQPLLLNADASSSSSSKGRTNSIGSKSVDLEDFSAETGSSEAGRLFISRQRILVARVLKKGIELYTYNYSKECADRLAKQLVFYLNYILRAFTNLSQTHFLSFS